MDIQFSTDVERVCWEELAKVVELAPLGKKDPKRKLSTADSVSEI